MLLLTLVVIPYCHGFVILVVQAKEPPILYSSADDLDKAGIATHANQSIHQSAVTHRL